MTLLYVALYFFIFLRVSVETAYSRSFVVVDAWRCENGYVLPDTRMQGYAYFEVAIRPSIGQKMKEKKVKAVFH